MIGFEKSPLTKKVLVGNKGLAQAYKTCRAGASTKWGAKQIL